MYVLHWHVNVYIYDVYAIFLQCLNNVFIHRLNGPLLYITSFLFGTDIREWSFLGRSVQSCGVKKSCSKATKASGPCDGRCSSNVATPNSKCFTTQKWDFESDFRGTFYKLLADRHGWADLPMRLVLGRICSSSRSFTSLTASFIEIY